MKYVRTFESFKNNNNNKPVNEEFLGAIGKFFGKMFKKAGENIRKTQGGNEIEVIYKKYLKLINDAIVKQTGLNLELGKVSVKESKVFEAEEAVAEEGEEGAVAEEGAEETTDKKPGEAEKKPAVDPKILKQKQDILKKIIVQMKGMAIKEMDAVLVKQGGGSKNPQLQIIINIKKDQFTLDLLNAEISSLEKSEDPESKKLAAAKQIEAKTLGEKQREDWVKFEKTGKPVEYKEDDVVIYKRKDFKEEEWNKLSDEEKTDEDKWDDVQVGSKSITKIDGDNFTFKNKDDKDITKPLTDILLKVKVKEEPKEETDESTEETTEDKANKLMDKEQEDAKAAGVKAKADRASEDSKK
jgi:hypothetical protein